MKLFQTGNVDVSATPTSTTKQTTREWTTTTSSFKSHFAPYFNGYVKNSDTTSEHKTTSYQPSFETSSDSLYGSTSSQPLVETTGSVPLVTSTMPPYEIEPLNDPNDLQDRCYLGFLTQNQEVLSAGVINNGNNGNMDNVRVKIAYRKDMV
jgi:hypothetical protein